MIRTLTALSVLAGGCATRVAPAALVAPEQDLDVLEGVPVAIDVQAPSSRRLGVNNLASYRLDAPLSSELTARVEALAQHAGMNPTEGAPWRLWVGVGRFALKRDLIITGNRVEVSFEGRAALLDAEGTELFTAPLAHTSTLERGADAAQAFEPFDDALLAWLDDLDHHLADTDLRPPVAPIDTDVDGESPPAPERERVADVNALSERERKRRAGRILVNLPVAYGTAFGTMAALELTVGRNADLWIYPAELGAAALTTPITVSLVGHAMSGRGGYGGGLVGSASTAVSAFGAAGSAEDFVDGLVLSSLIGAVLLPAATVGSYELFSSIRMKKLEREAVLSAGVSPRPGGATWSLVGTW